MIIVNLCIELGKLQKNVNNLFNIDADISFDWTIEKFF